MAVLSTIAIGLGSCSATDGGSDGEAGESSQRSAREGQTPPREGPCRSPYRPSSPWNTPVPRGAVRDPRRRALTGKFTSDPAQYTYPVYEVTSDTPRVPVRFSGFFSNVSDDDRRLRFLEEPVLELPISDGAEPAAGSDAQIIVVDRRSGDEWGLWHARRNAEGGWEAENGYHYDTDWDAVPPLSENGNPFGSRGAGVPYLAGLVRACEIARGRIDHALAFAYDYPSRAYVFPATKSDGDGRRGRDLPEGARLQLDPSIGERRIRGWGCSGPCLVIARALQRYGMYVIDNSGRPKVMLEYDGTAGWNGLVGEETVSPIPLSAFRVLAPCTEVGTDDDDRLRGTRGRDVICGRDGDDRIRARGGDDVVYGGWGDDDIHGGPGRDKLFGERGRDRRR